MSADEREFSAADLASRWLTVDQVLGRGGGWAAIESAGEYFAPDAIPANAEHFGPDVVAANGEQFAPESVAANGEHFAPDVVVGNGEYFAPGPIPASGGEHLAPDVVAGNGERPGPDLDAANSEHSAPDLVAADTDLASRWFTADRTLGEFAGRTVLLPFPTVAELATWPERLLWGHSRTEELCEWLNPGRVILGDETVARIWGRIVVAAQRTGSTPPANDAWIAAGCLSYGLPLATLNKRRYQSFADRYGLRLI
jgi:predicted nucleic acid-binding protein